MHRVLHILAQAYSIMLHPLLMPTYGILLLCYQVFVYSTPSPSIFAPYSALMLGGTILLTLLVPVGIILLMWKLNYIDSLHIEDSKQRTAPYIYTIMAYGVWIFFLRSILHVPTMVVIIAVGALLALLAVTVVNLWWKISAHLTGLGGLIGAICSYALSTHQIPSIALISALAIALLLMYARLYLEAHTPLQVVAGLLLGITCTCIPNIIIYA